MMWLFGLIYALNGIYCGDWVPRKRNSLTIPESEIRSKREALEQQHYVDYMVNEAIYRNWPEVHQNPKHVCQMFLQKIYRMNRNVDFTAEMQKVILNYGQIRDDDNNVLTPRRVTALECTVPASLGQRKLIYFIRSPQSPKCALFLNRIGKRSFNFYIVEDVCEHKEYDHFWNYTKELECGRQEERTRKYKRYRQKMLLLPGEEIRVKHAEYEQSHFEYCSINTEMCKLWPEVHMTPEYVCQQFLKRMVPKSHDLTLVTAQSLQATLHYSEIKNEGNGNIDPMVVYAILCQLPQPVQNFKHVYFIRAPSYPSCVFYGRMKVALVQELYISEEICDKPNHKTSLNSILSEQSSEFRRRREIYRHETSEKLHVYEGLHFQDYSIKRTVYEQWPELQKINIKSYCQTLLQYQLKEKYEIARFTAGTCSVKLKYATMSSPSNETIAPIKVMALECLVSGRSLLNRFRFIRTPKPNDCAYWIRRRNKQQHLYFIAKEICKGDGFSDQLEETFSNEGDPWYPELLLDDEFIDYLHRIHDKKGQK